MGYYIQGPTKGKAAFICQTYGGFLTSLQHGRETIKERPDLALICVVDNGAFEAAGFAYDERELEAFANDDGRAKTWLLLDRDKVKELTGYKGV